MLYNRKRYQPSINYRTNAQIKNLDFKSFLSNAKRLLRAFQATTTSATHFNFWTKIFGDLMVKPSPNSSTIYLSSSRQCDQIWIIECYEWCHTGLLQLDLSFGDKQLRNKTWKLWVQPFNVFGESLLILFQKYKSHLIIKWTTLAECILS